MDRKYFRGSSTLILNILFITVFTIFFSAGTVRVHAADQDHWTDWQVKPVTATDSRLVETKTQYSYQTKETTTSSSSSLPGWYYSSYSISYGSYGAWSTTKQSGSNLDYDERTYIKTYTMMHYCTGNVPGAEWQSSSSNNSTNAIFNKNCVRHSLGDFAPDNMGDFTYRNNDGVHDGYYYKGTNKDNAYRCPNTIYTWYAIPNYVTEYRARPIYTTYSFYRWTDYTDWSDQAVTSSSTRNVQTRVVYRYKAKDGDIAGCDITLDRESVLYDGSEQTAVATIYDGSKLLTEDVDYYLSYQNNVNAGTVNVTVHGIGDYHNQVASTFSIKKITPTFTFEEGNISKKTGAPSFINPLTTNSDGVIRYESSDPSVATVNSTTGRVIIQGTGFTVITVYSTEGTNFRESSASYNLSVSEKTLKDVNLSI